VKLHAFVAMPFGKKTGPDGTVIDFNAVYEKLLKPAIEAAGYKGPWWTIDLCFWHNAWEITEELRIEDDIDDEVTTLLDQYERQIAHQDLDQMLLRRKLKQELARKRGYTL